MSFSDRKNPLMDLDFWDCGIVVLKQYISNNQHFCNVCFHQVKMKTWMLRHFYWIRIRALFKKYNNTNSGVAPSPPPPSLPMLTHLSDETLKANPSTYYLCWWDKREVTIKASYPSTLVLHEKKWPNFRMGWCWVTSSAGVSYLFG